MSATAGAVPPQNDLVERLRAQFADESDVREVSMFGGRAFMVNDRMRVSAMRDGGLLVRVAPERSPVITQQEGVEIAEMGAGRSMGPSWLAVDPAAVATDEALARWLVEARSGAGKRE